MMDRDLIPGAVEFGDFSGDFVNFSESDFEVRIGGCPGGNLRI